MRLSQKWGEYRPIKHTGVKRLALLRNDGPVVSNWPHLWAFLCALMTA